jgi:hypothetical protein
MDPRPTASRIFGQDFADHRPIRIQNARSFRKVVDFLSFICLYDLFVWLSGASFGDF